MNWISINPLRIELYSVMRLHSADVFKHSGVVMSAVETVRPTSFDKKFMLLR